MIIDQYQLFRKIESLTFANLTIDNVHVYYEKNLVTTVILEPGQHLYLGFLAWTIKIYARRNIRCEVYNNDIANYMLNMQYIEEDSNPYVIVAPVTYL